MPNDRAFVRAERRLRSVLGCTHAALSSPLPAALIHNENFNLRWINATSVEKLRFRFSISISRGQTRGEHRSREETRSVPKRLRRKTDRWRKRFPGNSEGSSRRKVGQFTTGPDSKGRNGGGERVRTERQRANFRFYRAAIRARDISSVVVPFDLVAALRKGEWDLSARGAG